MSGDLFSSNQLIRSKNYNELFLIFRLSEKNYAIHAEQVAEIIQLPALTVVEKLPEHIVGLLNLRGQIINILDPTKLLGLEQKTYTPDHQVLIINHNGKTIGIVVDTVNDVIQLDRNTLEPLPYNQQEKVISGIYKHEKELVAFVDINKIIETVENINPELSILEDQKADTTHQYFPNDEPSKIKFLKRKEKLQKELPEVAGNVNYQENYFISCSLNKEIFCINLKYVKEITKLKLVNMAPVPCVPKYITGIINLRGEFITIVDIKHFLNIPSTNISEKTKIIVLNVFDMQVGIIVDDVFDIENIPAEKMNLNAQTKYEKNKFTSAEILLPDGQVMSVLDVKRFTEDERLYIEDSI